MSTTQGKIALFLSISTFILAFACVAGDDWLHAVTPDSEVYYNKHPLKEKFGLWKYCYGGRKYHGTTCTKQLTIFHWLQTVRFLIVVGSLLSFASVFSIFMVVCTQTMKPVIAPVLQFSTAVFFLIGLALFVEYKEGEVLFDFRYFIDRRYSVFFFNYARYGWSFYVGWGALLCSVISGCVCSFKCHCDSSAALREDRVTEEGVNMELATMD